MAGCRELQSWAGAPAAWLLETQLGIVPPSSSPTLLPVRCSWGSFIPQANEVPMEAGGGSQVPEVGETRRCFPWMMESGNLVPLSTFPFVSW